MKATPNDPELKSRQIVLMSGKPDLLAHRRSMEEGADDFPVKPFGLQEFLSCVKARFYRALLSWPAVERMAAAPKCPSAKKIILLSMMDPECLR